MGAGGLMIKIVTLFGEAGAGKDTLLDWAVQNLDVHGIISCTTRPPRDYEIQDKDYHFLTNEEFKTLQKNNQFIEYSNFNNWFYGTRIEDLSFDKLNIGVFNLDGITQLMNNEKNFDIKIYPIYIKTSNTNRLLRQLTREKDPDVEEILRRYQTDNKDFSQINFSYTIINNDSSNKHLAYIELVKEIERIRRTV